LAIADCRFEFTIQQNLILFKRKAH